MSEKKAMTLDWGKGGSEGGRPFWAECSRGEGWQAREDGMRVEDSWASRVPVDSLCGLGL